MRSLLGLMLLMPAVGAAAPHALQLNSDNEKLSYSLGVNVGEHFRDQMIEVDPKIFAEGVRDGLSQKTNALSAQDMQKILAKFEQDQVAKTAAQTKQLAQKNLQENSQFLAKNSSKEGIITLPSGLQYRELKAGQGEPPQPNDMVTVNYRGTLINGQEFDNSYTRGMPATFAVNAVIPGWTEALQLMRPGAKWQLFIPPELAYGELGAGRLIGPNAALIFEVELLSSNSKQAEEVLDIEPLEDIETSEDVEG